MAGPGSPQGFDAQHRHGPPPSLSCLCGWPFVRSAHQALCASGCRTSSGIDVAPSTSLGRMLRRHAWKRPRSTVTAGLSINATAAYCHAWRPNLASSMASCRFLGMAAVWTDRLLFALRHGVQRRHPLTFLSSKPLSHTSLHPSEESLLDRRGHHRMHSWSIMVLMSQTSGISCLGKPPRARRAELRCVQPLRHRRPATGVSHQAAKRASGPCSCGCLACNPSAARRQRAAPNQVLWASSRWKVPSLAQLHTVHFWSLHLFPVRQHTLLQHVHH